MTLAFQSKVRTQQGIWKSGAWHFDGVAPFGPGGPQLLLTFGERQQLSESPALALLRQRFPSALLFGCSTSGEISDTHVYDGTVVTTAIELKHTQLRHATVSLADASSGRDAGQRLASMLLGEGLRHVLVLSDGTTVNGSELVKGLADGLPKEVLVTGGLSGDGDRFEKTVVCFQERCEGAFIAAVGFYGDRLQVGSGCLGGWDTFGPERLITRSSGNVLFELDGSPALELYRRYLGEHAAQLPASALLFPLTLTVAGGPRLVRTILGIDEKANSMTFAGDMPEGARAQLMRANFERLIDGAHSAAKASRSSIAGGAPQLAILISCVGRKLVLKQRVEEEVEAVREVLGPNPAMTGFYSYGEISPFIAEEPCQLHNQTMTITTLSER